MAVAKVILSNLGCIAFVRAGKGRLRLPMPGAGANYDAIEIGA